MPAATPWARSPAHPAQHPGRPTRQCTGGSRAAPTARLRWRGRCRLADLEQQEALSLAFLRLLEALSPPERAVFLLHEVFEYPFREIGSMLEKSPANCRQILHRARQALQDKRARFEPEPQRQRQSPCRSQVGFQDL